MRKGVCVAGLVDGLRVAVNLDVAFHRTDVLTTLGMFARHRRKLERAQELFSRGGWRASL